jgi:hypothetical protein
MMEWCWLLSDWPAVDEAPSVPAADAAEDDGSGRGIALGALLGAALWAGLLQISWWALA